MLIFIAAVDDFVKVTMNNFDNLVCILFGESCVFTCAWYVFASISLTITTCYATEIESVKHFGVSTCNSPWFEDGFPFGGLHLGYEPIHATVEEC